jgi:hypothetical protein
MNGKTMFYLPPVVAAALAQLECYEPAAGTGGFLLQVPAVELANPPFRVEDQ